MRIALSQREVEMAERSLGRRLNEAELAVLDALWSEHCSYKSSKLFLRNFNTRSDKVLMGIEDWQDAGAIDIGDGWALILKVESHNHPSAIDPFNGAATGVGGVIRDVISKGAKPIALLDMIRVGDLSRPRNKWLLKNIIAGIGFYGNSIGVPVVAGELDFDSSFDSNPLVDVAALGLVRRDRIVPSVVKRPGLKLVIAGLTGIDGLGGASFASRGLSGEDEIGAVQIADPFAGKIILDATLEIADRVEAIKDLGGGGLAVAATEMANGLGLTIELDRLPLRVSQLTPAEMIVSETQERMLYAVDPSRVNEVCGAFEYYEYPCSVIGEVVDQRDVVFKYKGEEVVRIPSSLLLNPPLYSWDPEDSFRSPGSDAEVDMRESIALVFRHPALWSKEWAYSQFDYEVGLSTVIKPGEADASLLELDNGKYVAIKGDANPVWCSLDPYECGKGIFAESYLNLATVGAKGVAAVDHLQFGNPKSREVYGDFLNALRGIAEASKFFSVPIVGGKVSFHNESPEGKPIRPTPLVVMVGLSNGKFLRPSFQPGRLMQLGLARGEMNGSLLCQLTGKCRGIPKARLKEVEMISDVLVKQVEDGNILFVKDVNRGGLLGSLMPFLLRGFGVSLKSRSIPSTTSDVVEKLFSEAQGRAIALVREPEGVIKACREVGIHASVIGEVNDSQFVEVDEVKIDVKDHVERNLRSLEEAVR